MKINIGLSQQSIADAIAMLEQYKQDLMDRKIPTFLARLADEGLAVANATIMPIAEEEKGTTSVHPEWVSKDCIKLVMNGDKFLFVEFGAGIAFSSPQNPLAGEFGMGLGTYPGQTHAYQEEGWWYTDEATKQSKHSRGNAPYMPMYKADVEIMRKVSSIAHEVFGG